MRITPNSKYLDMPCAHVAIGTAYERRFRKPFPWQALSIPRADGYCTLREAEDDVNRPKRRWKRTRRPSYKNKARRLNCGLLRLCNLCFLLWDKLNFQSHAKTIR